MKKIVLLFIIALTNVGCGDDSIFYRTAWNVRNSTDQTLYIAFPPYSQRLWNFPSMLAPGETGVFYDRLGYSKEQDFELMRVLWGDWEEENISLEVRSANGTRLVEWKLSEVNQPDKNFFKESSWRFSTTTDDTEMEVVVDWSFEITQNDIL